MTTREQEQLLAIERVRFGDEQGWPTLIPAEPVITQPLCLVEHLGRVIKTPGDVNSWTVQINRAAANMTSLREMLLAMLPLVHEHDNPRNPLNDGLILAGEITAEHAGEILVLIAMLMPQSDPQTGLVLYNLVFPSQAVRVNTILFMHFAAEIGEDSVPFCSGVMTSLLNLVLRLIISPTRSVASSVVLKLAKLLEVGTPQRKLCQEGVLPAVVLAAIHMQICADPWKVICGIVRC
jgi:hypothetical protein